MNMTEADKELTTAIPQLVVCALLVAWHEFKDLNNSLFLSMFSFQNFGSFPLVSGLQTSTSLLLAVQEMAQTINLLNVRVSLTVLKSH